jgi:uncharacterized protein
MGICDRLYNLMAETAANNTVEILSVGLGYTAVCTSDGGIGLAFTPIGEKKRCTVIARDHDYEGKPASELLPLIRSDEPLLRAMALALINALNHPKAMSLPEDRKNDILFDRLGIREGSHVAMVGNFRPLVKKLQAMGVQPEVVDIGHGLGDFDAFPDKLAHWADALIMTSTTLLNDTADGLLAALGSKVRVVMIGPSTPLIPEAFADLPVHVIAGTVPVDREEILKAIRHGKGTPALQKHSRKPYLVIR